jgi:asparagine synthase (glutamine-hydrolysing)
MGLVGEPAKATAGDLAGYAMHKMEKGGRAWLLANLRRPGPGDDPEALLLEMVHQEMAPLSHIQDPDLRIKAFKTDQWSFRWTMASLRMFQAAAYPRLPFYDTRISDFFCTVPSAFVQGRRLQIDYLKRFAPDLARIKWQVYDTNLFRYHAFNTWLLPKRAVKKAWRLLRGKPVMERNWEVQFLNPPGRRGLEHWLLRPGLRLHDLFPPSALARLLQDFYQAPLAQKRGYTVSMLLTFSGWLERYC